ncbi:MAG: hypothetical protein MJ063_05360 [Lachnospiraceae bacterium]|nr:hypothetical protein [Lachnospiraceae bacterium]
MLKYYVFDPAGNVTLLVDTYIRTKDQVRIAAELMKREPLCEQVGFARVCGHNGKPEGHLRMAGGEFCGNASLCTGVLKRVKEKNNGISHMYPDGIDVTVSGTKGRVNVRTAAAGEDLWTASGSMPWPRSMGEITVDGRRLPYVDHGGIVHVIFTERPDRKAVERQIRKVCGEYSLKALGFMFLSGNELEPLVYVRETGTLYWENACASGTAAVAAWLSENSETKTAEGELKEPGGTVSFFADSDKKYVTLGTKIRLVKGPVTVDDL